MKRLYFDFRNKNSRIFNGIALCSLISFFGSITHTNLLNFMLAKDSETGALSNDFLKKMAEIFKPAIFIETGTFLGDTSARASKIFNAVHTIELSPEIYQKAKQRLKEFQNVTIHLGDSSSVLKNILKDLSGRLFFWLDGHFSGFHAGENTAAGIIKVPIIQELKIIKETGIKDSIILIDDIRLFDPEISRLPEAAISGYPTLDVIYSLLKDINSDYQIILLSDILIAFPQSQDINVSQIITACTQSRMFNGCNMSEAKIIEIEKIIAQASGGEKEAIKNLYKMFGEEEIWAHTYNVSKHYTLWYALTLLEDREFNQAYKLLSRIVSKGFHDNRIKEYLQYAQQNL